VKASIVIGPAHSSSITVMTGATMPKPIDIDDLILNYDPEAPQQRFVEAGLKAALLEHWERLPSPVPWPKSPPTATPLDHPPAETDDLSRFAGYDAIVMTWTAAEAAALAALFTPNYPPSKWYEDRHGIEGYVDLVTGSRSPFNDSRPEYARYYHSLGLYFPCKIGKARVLLFKSGLHLDYDGPKTPLQNLVTDLLQTVKPKLFITTGTGGGIGSDVALGDVVIAGRVKFDCTMQFKDEEWAHSSFMPSPVPEGAIDAITPALTRVNASRLPNAGSAPPKIWHSPSDAVVTTDFFGFDDSTDYYKLQGLGRVCDMGDAMVGKVLTHHPSVKWFSIRNASDPQIKNPSGNIQAANKEAGEIYAKYGPFTTAASVIATWAIIDAAFNVGP
jgi:nucleoside phosphorylase